jgi:7-cyano-7-deazaguanine synthase in queuosine biosynthesis
VVPAELLETADTTAEVSVPTYRLDDERVARSFSRALSARTLDLLEVVMAVYRQDRIQRRRPGGRRRDPYGLSWSREMDVEVGVRDLPFWLEQREQLERALVWLSDDRWRLRFTRRSGLPRPSETHAALFEWRPENDAVGLFSGGLDSLAGAVLDLTSHPSDELVLVSASTATRMQATQRGLARALMSRTGRVWPLLVRLGLSRSKQETEEPTQRTRGLLFLALAVAVADTAGLDEIRVYENGVGAMNLPYSQAQLGTHTSRAVHPKTLRLVHKLASAVCDREIRVEAPYFAYTKADLLRAFPLEHTDLIARSVSCDHGFTRRQRGPALCGRCTSCLLRRQALHAAELAHLDDSEAYRVDWLGCEGGDACFELAMMLDQVLTIERCLTAPDPWPQLVDEFPELRAVRRARETVDGDGAQHAIQHLLGRYVGDWHAVSSPTLERRLARRSLSQAEV